MNETDSGTGPPEGNLPATTADGAARAHALIEALNAAVAPTGLVSYVSSGRLALIGSVAESSPVAERIGDALDAVIVAPPGDGSGDRGAARVIHATITDVEGHLGAFTLHAESDGAPMVVAPSPLTGNRPFDVVIDLRPQPALEHEVLPPGYFAPPRRPSGARGGGRAGRGPRRRVREAPLLRLRPGHLRAWRVRHPRVHALSRRLPHRGDPLDRRARGGRSVSLPGGGGVRERVPDRSDHLCVSAAGGSARDVARGSRRLPGRRGTGAGAPVPRCGDRRRGMGARCARGARIRHPVGVWKKSDRSAWTPGRRVSPGGRGSSCTRRSGCRAPSGASSTRRSTSPARSWRRWGIRRPC